MSIHLRGASASERQRYGELVRPARMRQGLSQKALAALADVDRTTVSNIERGSGAPQEDVLRRLFAALGLATDARPQDPDVELWTAVMAELLSNVPPDRRHLAADAAIRDAGLMEHPVVLVSGAGWNLAQEFVNLYLGYGGSFFEAGSAAPAINNEAGIATLEMLKALTEFSNPDFLTFDSNSAQALWESGNAALAMMWGSRGGAILDDEGSTPEVVQATVLAGAPTVGGGGRPATTLWWDGFTIAANTSDADAEASFVAMMRGISPEVVAANAAAAVWLSPAYEPTPASAGVIASAQGGAAPYPMLPYMGLMHTALCDNLAAFLQGTASAAETLETIEAAYITAGRAQGFLN